MMFYQTLIHLIVGLLIGKGQLAFSNPPKAIIGADQWCPFFCEANQGFDGFSAELLKEALKSSGIKSHYITAPFARVTMQVENGNWQIHGATDSNFTPNLLIGKEAVAYSKWVFVVRSDDNWQYQGIQSLSGKRFGAINGYAYAKELQEYYKKKENEIRLTLLSSATPQKQALKMLISKRVDFLVEDENVIYYWAKKLKLENQIRVAGTSSEISFFPAYRNNDAEATKLANLVDQELGVLKKNKKFINDLIRKYKIVVWND